MIPKITRLCASVLTEINDRSMLLLSLVLPPSSHIACGKSLDEVRVDDFLVRRRYGNDIERGVQAVSSRVV